MHVLCIRNRNALFQIILQVFRSILVTGGEVHCVALTNREGKEMAKLKMGTFCLKQCSFLFKWQENLENPSCLKLSNPCTLPTAFALFLLLLFAMLKGFPLRIEVAENRSQDRLK